MNIGVDILMTDLPDHAPMSPEPSHSSCHVPSGQQLQEQAQDVPKVGQQDSDVLAGRRCVSKKEIY